MKLRIAAAFAALIAVVVALSAAGSTPVSAYTPAACGGPAAANLPQDHCYTVALSTYVDGQNPTTTTTLNLGTDTPQPTAPYHTGFFDEATASFQGVCPGTVGTPGSCTPPSKAAIGTPGSVFGQKTGTIGFKIQSNLIGGSPWNGTTGQPNACGAAGTLQLAPADFAIFSAVTDKAQAPAGSGQYPLTTPLTQPPLQPLGAGIVSTQSDTANPPYSFDQEPNLDHGGVPYAITHVPDWYGPLLQTLGIPTTTLIVGRSYGLAQAVPDINQTSVNFLTVNATAGVFINVTVLGNPIAVFNPNSAGQAILTCPPFGSQVVTFGSSAAGPWSCTPRPPGPGLPDGTYDTAKFTGACTGPFTGPSGTTLATLDKSVCASCAYEIALSSSPNLDGDLSSPAGYPLFNGQDNCKVDPNPTQADANSNGIGNVCKGAAATGGVTGATASAYWANSDPVAVLASQLPCDGVAHTIGGHAFTAADATALTAPVSGKWAYCQDADQDGALNSVDNCPLAPNSDQVSSQRDGLGDACRPAGKANAIGVGTGYLPGTLTGITSVGQFNDYDDICNSPFTIGTVALPGSSGTASCAALAAGSFAIFASPLSATSPGAISTFTTTGAINVVDSNDNGIPDFIDAGSGACIGDHKADSNHDGYSDFSEATPRTVAPTCTGFKVPGGTTPVTADPIQYCPGRDSSATATAAQKTGAKKAKADVDLDGKVTVLDISSVAGAFGSSVLGATDKLNEFDQDGDAKVTVLDISAVAGYFGSPVPPC